MVDDDPSKQDYAAPGTDMAIVSSVAMLADCGIITCLPAVGPRADTIVTQKCAVILGRGGRTALFFREARSQRREIRR
jgi:hypothetical protein